MQKEEAKSKTCFPLGRGLARKIILNFFLLTFWPNRGIGEAFVFVFMKGKNWKHFFGRRDFHELSLCCKGFWYFFLWCRHLTSFHNKCASCGILCVEHFYSNFRTLWSGQTPETAHRLKLAWPMHRESDINKLKIRTKMRWKRPEQQKKDFWLWEVGSDVETKVRN